MASVVTYGKDRHLRRIDFIGADGRRRSVRMGKASASAADALRRRVEDLQAVRSTGQPVPRDLALWADALDDRAHDRLAAAGLLDPRQRETLGAFLAEWQRTRTNITQGTRNTHTRAIAHLLEFFPADRDLRALTAADAARWAAWLRTERGLAEATARKSASIIKQALRLARQRGILDADPFAELVSNNVTNPDRQRYVTRDEAQTLIDIAPDPTWRLLIALGRYAGLRMPSEVRGLRWGDVAWDRGWFTVRSPKTRHHPGGDQRRVPIFPELQPHLLAAFEAAEPGETHAIPARYRTAANLRTQLLRLVDRGGLEPWPKPWHNLRASCETDLARTHPIHCVTAWLGNSVAVAQRHYLMVRDEDFTAAAGTLPDAVQTPEKAQQKEQQKPQQHAPAPAGTRRHDERPASTKTVVKQGESRLTAEKRKTRQLALPGIRWAKQDSNLRRRKPTGLQPVPIGRSGIRPGRGR